jgi:KaiC/GvpD/RAD55 family RecA-like ATPase
MSQRSSLPSHDPLERLTPGRIHILVGGPGTGKTTLGLRFLGAGLALGERAAMLVMTRGSDVKAHARRLGIAIDDALRFERLMLLRYLSDFDERRARTASSAGPVDELARLLSSVQPSRIVIDSFAPLLGEQTSGGQSLAALAAYLDQSGATSLLTYPEDISNGYDRRLEPLMQNAAAIFRLQRRSPDQIDSETLTTRVDVVVAGRDAAHASIALPS